MDWYQCVASDRTAARIGAGLPLDGYIRVSRVGPRASGNFISPEVQEEQIRSYASVRGREVGRLHVELDRSGTDASRPRFREALRRVCEGESGGVIVAKLDRFGRSVPDALDAIRQIHEAGGEFISVEDGFDSSTPFGKAMMTILLALAELEVARIRDGWDHANRRAVERGIHSAPYPPTGYKRGASGRLVPDTAVANAVAEAFHRRARGDSYDAIARFLEEAGVLTSRGNKWTGKSVFRIISNPAYTGEARYGQYRNPNAHEPLVSRRLWVSVQPGMPGRVPRPNAKSLLAGLIRCASCLHAMTGQHSRVMRGPHAGTYRYAYCCRSLHGRGRCPAPAYVSMDAIDAVVTEKFFRVLETRDSAKRQIQLREDLPESPPDLGDQSLQMTHAQDALMGNESTTSPSCQEGLKTGDAVSWSVFARRARAAKLAGLPPLEDVRRAWPSMPCSLRRTYLAAVFDGVFVAKGRRQLENRVRLVLAGDLFDQRCGPSQSVLDESTGSID